MCSRGRSTKRAPLRRLARKYQPYPCDQSADHVNRNGHSSHPPADALPNGNAPSLETTARIASLLLDARTRVLTLSEQKAGLPALPARLAHAARSS
jgi:hypothetical protein